jgi:hypothetical protein
MKESNMKITLLNYNNDKIEYDIGDLDNIKTITRYVISGDEVIDVRYKDGSVQTFDSDNNTRAVDLFDVAGEIYNNEVNWLNSEEFLSRKDSYDFHC